MIRLLLAIALVGGTVHTAEGPPLENGTVLIEGNRVQAVGTRVPLPAGTEVIDVTGKVVTPGLIEADSRLGVSDVPLEATSVEATLPGDADRVRASLRVADTFNPESLTLPIARAGGITSAVVVPSGGLISGQSIWADLTGRRPVRRDALALHVHIGADEKPGGRARDFLRLRAVLEDAHLYQANRGPYIARRLRDLSITPGDADVLRRALDGELPVVFHVSRASDIETVLGIAREHGLRAILEGADEGWLVADSIARAGVPVLVNPLQNLPSSFDALHARADNALLLHEAGVAVIFSQGGASQLAHRLRWLAGNAVRNGYPRDDALVAITRRPALVFGMNDTGAIRAGALANLVVWNGDPFEVTTWAERIFVRGKPVDLETRQDALTHRYARGN